MKEQLVKKHKIPQRGLVHSRHFYNISNALFRVVPAHCIYEIL